MAVAGGWGTNWSMSAALITIMAGIFAAGFLRGFTGFGLALAAVPILALVLPPQLVVPIIVTLQLLSGAIDIPLAWRAADWRSLPWLAAGMVICTPLGLLALSFMSADVARLVLGGLILGSVAMLARGARLPAHPRLWITLLVGAISGVMNGLAAMAGPPAVVYFLAQARTPQVIRATTISYFVLTAIAAIIPMAWRGLATWETTIWGLVSLPALLAGQWLGTMGFRRVSPTTQWRVALLTLTALATLLSSRALLALLQGT